MTKKAANTIWWVVALSIPIDIALFFIGAGLHNSTLCRIGLYTVAYKALALLISNWSSKRVG